MVFAAGMGEYDLVEFAEWKGVAPRGWVDIGLEGVGGSRRQGIGGEGVLRCMMVQVRVLENHQNGKDTHLRGVQLFARDGMARRSEGEEWEEDGPDRGEDIGSREWEERAAREPGDAWGMDDWEGLGRMELR